MEIKKVDIMSKTNKLKCNYCDEDVDPGGWCENPVEKLHFMWSHLKNYHSDNKEAIVEWAGIDKELSDIKLEA